MVPSPNTSFHSPNKKKGVSFKRATPRFKQPLAYIFSESLAHSSESIRNRLHGNERIRSVHACTNVTSACETRGELLLADDHSHFVADEPILDPSLTQTIFGEREVHSLSWQHCDVTEVCLRWWQLRDTALEVFLVNGRTYLLAFNSTGVSLFLICFTFQKLFSLQIAMSSILVVFEK